MKPLSSVSAWDRYRPALETARRRIRDFGPDALVVSLGVDTFEHDPISKFKLKHADYPAIGGMIAAARRPTLFVMEGGYAIDALGVNVLSGFEQTP